MDSPEKAGTSSLKRRGSSENVKTMKRARKALDQSKKLGRQAMNKTLDGMEKIGIFPTGNSGQKITQTTDVVKQIERMRQDIERLEKQMDSKFKDIRSEIKAVSDNLELTKNNLYDKLIISNINEAMTRSTREEFMTNFNVFKDFFNEYKASIEDVNSNVEKLQEAVRTSKVEAENKPSISKKYADSYLRFTQSLLL